MLDALVDAIVERALLVDEMSARIFTLRLLGVLSMYAVFDFRCLE